MPLHHYWHPRIFRPSSDPVPTISFYASFLDRDEICDYYSEDYDYDECQLLQNKCKTVDGEPCTFPFMFRSHEVKHCLSGTRRTQPWCPTEIDSNGGPVPGKWGVCNEHCPTEGADDGRSLQNSNL